MNQLTMEQAAAFAAMPLDALRREYPNHIMHVLNGPEDVLSPHELHPVFYGSYDWHSAVHGFWLLARCARLYPDLPSQDAIATLFDEHFTVAGMAVETTYFQTPNRESFERPYGFGWLLALAHELDRWQHPRARTWLTVLQPLVTEIRARLLKYLSILPYPIRSGAHYNTAFALALAFDYARHYDDHELATAITDTANVFYGADQNYPAHIEPGGDEFLSPALTGALLMSKTLDAAAFDSWFNKYLPDLSALPNLMQAARLSDRTDPKVAHLDGLNLSRVWCLRQIAQKLPAQHAVHAQLTAAIAHHLNASLPHVVGSHYSGSHWLASFAMLALENSDD